MASRTFTVLFTRDDEDTDRPTDEEAIQELAESLQAAYDAEIPLGGNFIIVSIEDGDDRFWQAHKSTN